jgi:hypothetical protein
MSDEEGRSQTVSDRVHRVQEDLMGNEALNEALEESAASELLSWGLKSAEEIASTTEGMDAEAAELSMADRLKALRKLMRHLGRLLGEARDLDTDGRLWLWESVQEQARVLYGEGLSFPPLDEIMGRLSQGESAGQIIASLREMFEGQSNR